MRGSQLNQKPLLHVDPPQKNHIMVFLNRPWGQNQKIKSTTDDFVGLDGMPLDQQTFVMIGHTLTETKCSLRIDSKPNTPFLGNQKQSIEKLTRWF